MIVKVDKLKRITMRSVAVLLVLIMFTTLIPLASLAEGIFSGFAYWVFGAK